MKVSYRMTWKYPTSALAELLHSLLDRPSPVPPELLFPLVLIHLWVLGVAR